MITAMCDVMRRCYDKGWITTRDGNASLRRKNSDILYITPSGVRKNVIRVEDLVKIKIENNELIIPDNNKPSGELHMHKLLQLNNNDQTTVVLHVHPTHIISAMYSGYDLQLLSNQFPEVNRYTRVGPSVPVLPVVSKELGDETYLAMTSNNKIIYDIVGQDRHGVCVIAKDPWSCYEHIERLEHICEIVLKSKNTH